MKTTDLNPERSEKYRHLEKLGYLPKFIIISACCGFLAAIAVVLSVLAMYNSTDANAKVDYELQATRAEIIESNNIRIKEIRLLQNKVDRLQAELKVLEDH